MQDVFLDDTARNDPLRVQLYEVDFAGQHRGFRFESSASNPHGYRFIIIYRIQTEVGDVHEYISLIVLRTL